ncbi:AraC-like DNA-binding protein [Fluviicoccus keumensis]|uniref:AraC-like DNA-binding protein n=1 Tax=Fluviicoccus keumensis TaxID=1435465 RepID=A0A4Q7ZBB6_9GAMM|nr:AraC family transcriptional regulator [Fluviicoccus keumensis]RZU47421.1 AraC-like DNA-binding protein [Fluviicoccus keumensis]
MPPDFPATYSRLLVRELRLDEAGVARLLAGSGVTSGQLFRLDALISAPDQYRIILNALALSGNPALGLQIGCRMPLSAHGAMGVAASSAPTPRLALDMLERFGILRLPVMTMNRVITGEHLQLTLFSDIPYDPVGIFLMEALIASIFWVIEQPLGRPVTGAEIGLGYAAPDHAARYAAHLHGRVTFGHAHTVLRLPLSELDTPNPFADPEVHAEAVRQCERQRASLETRETWRTRVVRVLQQHPGQLWTITEVAAALHVSARSLTRHLAAEQATYQQLLDEELCRQAQLHLELPGHTVASVAATLGYQDVSAFRRAFKRWTGVPPQDWRSAR